VIASPARRRAPRSVAVVFLATWALTASPAPAHGAPSTLYDFVIRGGTIYDGTGNAAFQGDVAIQSDRIVYVGPHAPRSGRKEVDAHGKAVSPGFVNMLAHPEESLLIDGRALSDLVQGVTLEVIGESSMGPLTPEMKTKMLQRQTDLQYPITWTTLGEYLSVLQSRGIAPNVASYVGAGTVRTYVLGEKDIEPTPTQLIRMRELVRRAMEEGALGLTTALIYSPNGYAKTPELSALAQESARCGGLYSVHMRSEGDRVMEAVQETIDIARASGGPAEIYHLKLAGKRNWGKFDALVQAVNAARASGVRISADMYVYARSATGLDAAMPPWVQDGGLEAWIARLRDPEVRARVLKDMRDASPTWENLMAAAGADGTLLLGFKTEALKPLAGKTLGEVARKRGKTPEDTAIDLVIEDGSRIEVAYSLMSEENVRRQIALPWVSFDSDADAPAPEGVFLKSSRHPRAYGNFARLLGEYVREDELISLPEAIRKLTSLPAATLSLKDRGFLRPGYFADVVVFDPKTLRDHATYEHPQELATGAQDVWVNGVQALDHGRPTGAASGRAIRGRAWTGAKGGGCRKSAADWRWAWP
jgi:N-acyl-D-amino-acid deacylase